MRTGLITKKLGMSYVVENNIRIPVTLLFVDNCQVTAIKNKQKDGYTALQLGVGSKKESNVAKPQKVIFDKAGISYKRKLAEFRVEESAIVDIGTEITAEHFIAGQYVDVTGTSIGKGFAGVMKRHNFGGLRASHGVSVSHRSHGSTGMRQDPGKVQKGKKMAGHLGDEQVTIQSIMVVRSDDATGIIAVKGAVPGCKGSYVLIKDAVKKARPSAAPFPAKIKSSGSKLDNGAQEQPQESAPVEGN